MGPLPLTLSPLLPPPTSSPAPHPPHPTHPAWRQPQRHHDYVIVYRCSLCLWFAIAGYVVTMWADVTNAHHSRASRMLWVGYLVAVVCYAVLVPMVTILATKIHRVDQNTALLATPDVVRITGEVGAIVACWCAGVCVGEGEPGEVGAIVVCSGDALCVAVCVYVCAGGRAGGGGGDRGLLLWVLLCVGGGGIESARAHGAILSLPPSCTCTGVYPSRLYLLGHEDASRLQVRGSPGVPFLRCGDLGVRALGS
jgi:hypothetical protein